MTSRKLLHRAGDHSQCRPEVCEHAPPAEASPARPLRLPCHADYPVTLTDLARSRYETGRYGNGHLALRREDMDRLPKAEKPQGFAPLFGGGLGLAHLTGIPVVIDDELVPLRWELRDNSTKRVITAGTLLADFLPGSR